MSALPRMKIPQPILDAIRSTLPPGELIQHVAMVFVLDKALPNYWLVKKEYFLAVTDTVLAFRQFPREWDLSEEQLDYKNELERKQVNPFTRLFRRVEEVVYDVENSFNAYEEGQVVWLLENKFGQLGVRWLPDLLYSDDVRVEDISVHSYRESEAPTNLKNHVRNFGHQVEIISHVEYSIGRSINTIGSFFGDLHEIFKHIQNQKLQNVSTRDIVDRTSKCSNCGSTDLTYRSGFMICDYCKSKFA